MAASAAGGRYDGSLQMFVEAPHDVDLARLRFLRWLIETGRLGHGTAGPATGELARLVTYAPRDDLSLAN
jgi:hypothetical protein